MNWTEPKIQALLAIKFGKTGSICVPNCSAFGWESDLLRLTGRWLCAEYEIKTSRADFRADARGSAHKGWRHQCLERRPAEAPYRCPNFFWYAAPAGVIPLAELPAHAGLVEIVGSDLVLTRKAPRLHKQPIGSREATYILRGVALRYWSRRYAEAMSVPEGYEVKIDES